MMTADSARYIPLRANPFPPLIMLLTYCRVSHKIIECLQYLQYLQYSRVQINQGVDTMRKTIITVAPTGEEGSKKTNPALPTSPVEIAEAVYQSYLAGASIAHLHMRDDNGMPTMSLDKFRETVQRVRDKCDIVINLTTSGDIRAGDEVRMAHLVALKPEIATFDCGTMNWMRNDVFMNHPHFLTRLGQVMQENNIKPEVEIFDSGMLFDAFHFVKKGVLLDPVHYQFVLGVGGGMPATVENLAYLVRQLPENATWSAFGVGKDHLTILSTALVLGGDVRVGFEDNIYYAKGVPAESNAQLVARAARIIKEFNLEIATPKDVRERFNLRNY